MLARLHTLDGFQQPRALARTARFSRAYELTIDADSLNLAARFKQSQSAQIRPSIIVLAVITLAFAAFIIVTDGLPDYRGLGTGVILATALTLAGAFWHYGSRLLIGRFEPQDSMQPYREIALSEIENTVLDDRDVWLWVHTLEIKRTLILRHRNAEEAAETNRRLIKAEAE